MSITNITNFASVCSEFSGKKKARVIALACAVNRRLCAQADALGWAASQVRNVRLCFSLMPLSGCW